MHNLEYYIGIKFRNLVSSILPPKNVKIKIHRIIILPS
jgi:hypothetical protein